MKTKAEIDFMKRVERNYGYYSDTAKKMAAETRQELEDEKEDDGKTRAVS